MMRNHTFYQIGIVLLTICFFFTQLGNENINLDKSRLYIVLNPVNLYSSKSSASTHDLYSLNQHNFFKNFEKNLLDKYINKYSKKYNYSTNPTQKYSKKLRIRSHYIFQFEKKIEEKMLLDLVYRLEKYFNNTYTIEIRVINE